MRTESIKCDECGRIKGEGNHWHQLGTAHSNMGRVWIEIGDIPSNINNDKASTYEIHDLCGEQCFYKHIGKLLKLNPVEIDIEAPSV